MPLHGRLSFHVPREGSARDRYAWLAYLIGGPAAQDSLIEVREVRTGLAFPRTGWDAIGDEERMAPDFCGNDSLRQVGGKEKSFATRGERKKRKVSCGRQQEKI